MKSRHDIAESSRAALLVLAALSMAACQHDGQTSEGGGARIAIAVAPLTTPGVEDACYRLTVTNADGEVVWTLGGICADQYGDNKSAISYVGPCDAAPVDGAPQANTVTLELEDLWDAEGLIDRDSYKNPCRHLDNGNDDGFGPCEREVECLENADAPVTYNLTILRNARQGFFDIAVNFEDIFCSAKVDCLPNGLLHDADGTREATVVYALACTGGAGSGGSTLLFDDIAMTCSDPAADATIVTHPAQDGNQMSALDAQDPGVSVYQVGIYQGAQELGCGVDSADAPISCQQIYSNTAIGIGAAAMASTCRLTTQATAGSGSFGPATPGSSSYPIISIDVRITDGTGALICGANALDAGEPPSDGEPGTGCYAPEPAGVCTGYTDGAAQQGVTFTHRYPGGQPSPPNATPRFTAAPNWNDYVVGNSDVACTGSESLPADLCRHGGEQRLVRVAGKTSCTDLTATDALGAFDWTCAVNGGNAEFTSRLKADKSLADLVTAAGWIDNSVTIWQGTTAYVTSTPGAWWGNPVAALPDSAAARQTLNGTGTIYVAETSAVVSGYDLGADHIGIALRPGVVLTASGTLGTGGVFTAVGKSYLSVEGSTPFAFGVAPTWPIVLTLNSAQKGISLTSTSYVRARRLGVYGGSSSGGAGIRAYSVVGLELHQLSADRNRSGVEAGIDSDGRYTQLNFFNNYWGMDFCNGPGAEAANRGLRAAIEDVYVSGPENDSICGSVNFATVDNFFVNSTWRDNFRYGIRIAGSNSTWSGLTVLNSDQTAAVAVQGNGNDIRRVRVHGGKYVGLSFTSASSNNVVSDVIVANRTSPTPSQANCIDNVSTGTGNVLRDVRASNCAGYGLRITKPGLSVQGAYLANNGLGGASIEAGATLAAMTVIDNGGSGITVNVTNAAQPVVLHNMLVANHALNGISVTNAAGSLTLSQIALFDNAAALRFAGPSTVKVVGPLLLGNNVAECDAVTAPTAGIAQGIGAAKPCELSAPSTGTVVGDVTGYPSSLLGPVTDDDQSNTSDTNGISTHAGLSDWFAFDHPERLWGLASGNPFPSADQRGSCVGGVCQIWDLALAASDTVLRNTSFDGIAQNASGSGGGCPPAVSGATAETSYDGSATFLPSAIESAESNGNLNGLCEANEDCLYAPNFGAYQGSGMPTSCTYSAAGGPNGVAMSILPTNGR